MTVRINERQVTEIPLSGNGNCYFYKSIKPGEVSNYMKGTDRIHLNHVLREPLFPCILLKDKARQMAFLKGRGFPPAGNPGMNLARNCSKTNDTDR